MKKLIYPVFAAALLLALVAGSVQAGDAPDNTVAVCGCGMVFTPSASTKYIEYEGHKYACCTDACHEMAAKDPAAAAKMSHASMEKFMNLNHMKMTVANVMSVTETGTQAMCGCGKKFTIDNTTEYLKVDGENYACCTHACHELASKDPAACATAAKANMKKAM
jgi:YHS domain-containing protein